MEQVPKQCPPDECLGAFGSVFVFFEYRMLPEKRFFAASPTIVSGDASFAENEPNKTDRQGLPQQVKNNRAEPVGERPARILIRNRCKLPVWDFRKTATRQDLGSSNLSATYKNNNKYSN
jgi:hypothetical protein